MENHLTPTPILENALPFSIAAPESQPRELKEELRSGSLCPRCKKGRLDYDGMLNLVCEGCGFGVGGCFT